MKTEPTEAEALAKQAVKKITDSLMFEINYEEDNYDAGYSAALHNHGEVLYMMGFSEGQSNPKIKQLEWGEGYFDIIANTLYGKYIVSKPVSGGAFILYLNNSVINAFFNIDEAKAFAQKDFEARIKECLMTEL